MIRCAACNYKTDMSRPLPYENPTMFNCDRCGKLNEWNDQTIQYEEVKTKRFDVPMTMTKDYLFSVDARNEEEARKTAMRMCWAGDMSKIKGDINHEVPIECNVEDVKEAVGEEEITKDFRVPVSMILEVPFTVMAKNMEGAIEWGMKNLGREDENRKILLEKIYSVVRGEFYLSMPAVNPDKVEEFDSDE